MATQQITVSFGMRKCQPRLLLSLCIAINITVVYSIKVATRDRITSTTGDTVELPCRTDAGHATVYWKRGPSFKNSTLVVNVFKGEAYPRRPNVRMDAGNYSMWLDDVQLSDTGSYLCVVAPSPRLGLPKMNRTWVDVIDLEGSRTTTPMMQDSYTELILNISDPSTVSTLASSIATSQTNTPAISHLGSHATSTVTDTTKLSTSLSSGKDDQTEPDVGAITPSSTGSTGTYSTHPASPDDGEDEIIIMINLGNQVKEQLSAFSNASNQGSFINYINILLSSIFVICASQSIACIPGDSRGDYTTVLTNISAF